MQPPFRLAGFSYRIAERSKLTKESKPVYHE